MLHVSKQFKLPYINQDRFPQSTPHASLMSYDVDGLVQDCSKSIANALKLPQ